MVAAAAAAAAVGLTRALSDVEIFEVIYGNDGCKSCLFLVAPARQQSDRTKFQCAAGDHISCDMSFASVIL